jgi:hypothetical protein
MSGYVADKGLGLSSYIVTFKVYRLSKVVVGVGCIYNIGKVPLMNDFAGPKSRETKFQRSRSGSFILGYLKVIASFILIIKVSKGEVKNGGPMLS